MSSLRPNPVYDRAIDMLDYNSDRSSSPSSAGSAPSSPASGRMTRGRQMSRGRATTRSPNILWIRTTQQDRENRENRERQAQQRRDRDNRENRLPSYL